jgi:hypothetical protein
LLALLASLLVEEGFRSTSKQRLIFYTPQLRQIQPILPSNLNRQISIHGQTTSKSFSSSGSFHCFDPASISKIAVLSARSMPHGGAPRSAVQRSDRRTPLTFGHGRFPRVCSAPPVSVFPRLRRLLRFAPPWPLRTLVAPLGSPPPPRPPAHRVADSLALVPGHTAFTLLRSLDRLLRHRRPTGHRSFAIPLGPQSPPRVFAGRLACRLGRLPPRPGPSPPPVPHPPMTVISSAKWGVHILAYSAY